MKRIVWRHGLIAGGMVAAMTAVMVPLGMNGVIDFSWGAVIGYTSMVLSFLLVFFGIRSYRDDVGGGVITFGKAFQVGILIALIASAVYVISWEIVYFNFIPDFADRYAAITIEKLRASGASEAVLAAETAKMAKFQEQYTNPLFNIAVTFMEIFPVGLVVTLVSAAILRRKTPPQEPAASAVPA